MEIQVGDGASADESQGDAPAVAPPRRLQSSRAPARHEARDAIERAGVEGFTVWRPSSSGSAVVIVRTIIWIPKTTRPGSVRRNRQRCRGSALRGRARWCAASDPVPRQSTSRDRGSREYKGQLAVLGHLNPGASFLFRIVVLTRHGDGAGRFACYPLPESRLSVPDWQPTWSGRCPATSSRCG